MVTDHLKIPPHSVEAEQSVIGSVMLDVSVFDDVAGLVNESDFYRGDHRLIWSAIFSLRSASVPGAVDVVTLSEYLDGRGLLADAGGLSYLGTLAKDTPSASNARDYAQIVRDKSLRRQLITAANQAAAAAFDDGDATARDLIGQFESSVFALADRAISHQNAMVPIKSALKDLVQVMDEQFTNPPESGVIGESVGFADLDKRLSGLEAGELVVIAGRPAMGKSTLALNIARAVAAAGKPAVVFSLEMPTRQIAQKVLSAAGSVPMGRVISPWSLLEQDWVGISTGASKVAGLPMYVDDTASCSVNDIAAKCRRLRRELEREYPGGLGLVVVDYLQLLQPANPNTRANRAEIVGEFSRGLKVLAKELAVPVIALSQLNRGLESRPNKRPMMSDLRDSGAVEQDADDIIFIYRDEIYNEDTPDKGVAEIITAKQRMGPTGTDRLVFQGEFSRFVDYSAAVPGNWS